jgi:hypothetical protein
VCAGAGLREAWMGRVGQLLGCSACSAGLGLGFIELLLQLSRFLFSCQGFLRLGFLGSGGFLVTTREAAGDGIAGNGAHSSGTHGAEQAWAARCLWCGGCRRGCRGGRSGWGCGRSRCCGRARRCRCNGGCRGLGRGRAADATGFAHALGVCQRRSQHGDRHQSGNRSGGANRKAHGFIFQKKWQGARSTADGCSGRSARRKPKRCMPNTWGSCVRFQVWQSNGQTMRHTTVRCLGRSF